MLYFSYMYLVKKLKKKKVCVWRKKKRNKAIWAEILSGFPGNAIIVSLMYQYILEYYP